MAFNLAETQSLVRSGLGSEIVNLLNADDLKPGDEPSYQACKAIYIYHPMGLKMAETPIRLAQSQNREITVPESPEDEVVAAWQKQWDDLECSDEILNVMTQARMYGAASIALLPSRDEDPISPLDLKKLATSEDLAFNVLDPLNTAGSLVTSQDPNSPTFQKWGMIRAAGRSYHPSRTCTMLNERSLYIAWTSSAYGYVGRSVYTRAFYPLKSFLWTMVTDEMVARKAGLIVARLEQPGTIVDRIWRAMAGVKRALLKEARSDNVISVGTNELIETLNMRNVEGSMRMSREDIIKNIATAADMPAKMLTQESFVEGFGEGTQDAYAVAQYIDRVRIEMRRIYSWFDTICMYRAWTPEFYATIQKRYEDYAEVSYTDAFYQWRNSFRADWPSLIKEKPSESVQVEDIKLKAVIAIIQVLAPLVDPMNQAEVLRWLADQVNQNEEMFGAAHLELDFEELVDHLVEQQQMSRKMMGPGGEDGQLAEEENSAEPPKPFSGRDSARARREATAYLDRWLAGSAPMRELQRLSRAA